jgi:tetrahydromethanopterin S-methyltransferase subunit H
VFTRLTYGTVRCVNAIADNRLAGLRALRWTLDEEGAVVDVVANKVHVVIAADFHELGGLEVAARHARDLGRVPHGCLHHP